MGIPTDRVIVNKQESAAQGGDAADSSPLLIEEPLDPTEDLIAVAGINGNEDTATGGPGADLDEDVRIYRHNGEWWFEDKTVTTPVNLDTLNGGVASAPVQFRKHFLLGGM
jgi:hypothetical protein